MLTLSLPGQLFRSSLNSVCTTADCVTAGEGDYSFLFCPPAVSHTHTTSCFLTTCESFPPSKPLASCRTWISPWSLVIISTSTPAGVGWSDMSYRRRAPVTASLTFWGTSWRLSSKVSLISSCQWAAALWSRAWVSFREWNVCMRFVVAGVLETENGEDRAAIRKAKILYSSCMNESKALFMQYCQCLWKRTRKLKAWWQKQLLFLELLLHDPPQPRYLLKEIFLMPRRSLYSVMEN